MEKELTLREIQQGELVVLKKIKEICEQSNTNYFLIFGTLLGAIRHKGIIPWDDDIDVGMMREDYEKFISYCTKHKEELLPFKLYHYSTKKDYIYPIARFVDTRYWVDYQDVPDYNLGLFVDIYPFDGCGNSKEERSAVFRKVRKGIMPLISLGARSNVLNNHGLVNYIVKCILRGLAIVVGQNRLLRIVDKRAKKYSIPESTYVNCLVWDNTYADMFPRADFMSLTDIQFEDSTFKIPQNYDRILKLEYDDYMQLPPEEDRIGHHFYKVYHNKFYCDR